MMKKMTEFKGENGLHGISKSYKKFGIHKLESESINGKHVYLYHEWAPGAQEISIFG